MTFLTDEGLDFPVVVLLRKKGFTVIYAAEEYVAASDDAWLQLAAERNYILITKDKDFGRVSDTPKQSFSGSYFNKNRKIKSCFELQVGCWPDWKIRAAIAQKFYSYTRGQD